MRGSRIKPQKQYSGVHVHFGILLKGLHGIVPMDKQWRSEEASSWEAEHRERAPGQSTRAARNGRGSQIPIWPRERELSRGPWHLSR